MIACVRNNIIIEQPQVAPKTWIDPETKLAYSGFKNMNLDDMFELGWKEVVDESPTINSTFENLEVSDWYFDSTANLVTRDYNIILCDYSTALTNAFNELDKNREMYEEGGFEYEYNGIPVKIFTDQKSSQGKLVSGLVSSAPLLALDSTAGVHVQLDSVRQDTDVWKFQQLSDGATLVFQVSNADIINIARFVYRTVQDAYNLQSYLAWQMLGCEDTETLKNAVESGTIPLNPWGV